MLNYQRYKRVPVVPYPERTWPDKEIEKAPIWCNWDLRRSKWGSHQRPRLNMTS